MSFFVTVATWDPTRQRYDAPRVHVLAEHEDIGVLRDYIEEAHAAPHGAARCSAVRRLLRLTLSRPRLLTLLRSHSTLSVMWKCKMREFRAEPALTALCDETLRVLA